MHSSCTSGLLNCLRSVLDTAKQWQIYQKKRTICVLISFREGGGRFNSAPSPVGRLGAAGANRHGTVVFRARD